MPTQYRLPLQPAGAEDVNDVLAIQRAKDQVAYFAAGVPVFTHAAGDRVGLRLAAVQLVELELADATTLGRALGLDRSTIFRCQRKVRAAGVSGLVDARPGPKAPHKLTAERQAQVQDQLAQGASLLAIDLPPAERLLALVTVVCLGSAFLLFRDTQFLMPGPLASAHGAIENCSACHTKSGSGKLSWIHGLVAGDPLADSKACLTCHRMPDTAFNAHSASAEVLKQSTARLTKIAAGTPQPQSARAQSTAFPTHDVVARGLYCATCHQEHQGVNFNLNKISNEQCHSCHVVKFDSFDGHHPKFENYPFKRRTRIIYDHAGHFGKHFPEVAKKDPARRIPATCSTCRSSSSPM